MLSQTGYTAVYMYLFHMYTIGLAANLYKLACICMAAEITERTMYKAVEALMFAVD